jgi:hypothetical protein
VTTELLMDWWVHSFFHLPDIARQSHGIIPSARVHATGARAAACRAAGSRALKARVVYASMPSELVSYAFPNIFIGKSLHNPLNY